MFIFDGFARDIRCALRTMRRSPGFTTIMILSLGLGIGANTAIFSIVNSVLLRPLAYREPGRLYSIGEIGLYPSLLANPLHIQEWRRQCSSIEQIVAMRLKGFYLTGTADPELLRGAQVSTNLFSMLGVEPQLGRAFLDEEGQSGRDQVVLLSGSLWRRRFQADPSLVGRPILLDGQRYQVVGILPASFRLPYSGGLDAQGVIGQRTEVFKPLVIPKWAQDLRAALTGPSEQLRLMGDFNYAAVARLKRGATPQQALAELNVVQAQFPRQAGVKVDLRASLTPLHEQFVGPARRGLWMLLGAVGAVLLIVCVNLANLMLARTVTRSRESAIRTALGASRGRLLRQALTESLLHSWLGGALGVLLAVWGISLLIQAAPIDLPRLHEVRLDGRVLWFALFLSMSTGLLFGLLPAWQLTQSEPQAAMRAGTHTATEGSRGVRLRELLISLEVALGAALLIVAGLLANSFLRLLHVDKGFEAQSVLTADLTLPSSRYPNSGQRDQFFQQLLPKLHAISGVLSAGFITALPARGETWIDPVALEGDRRPIPERAMANYRWVSPNYFKVLSIPIRRGRAFEESDRGKLVGILSEKTAQRLWPGQDPIGKKFIDGEDKPYTVVGVVANVRASLHREPPLVAYYPYWQDVPRSVSLTVRAAGDPRALMGAVRAAIRSEDSEVPIQETKTMQQVVASSVAQRRFQMELVLLFAFSALLVASLGIYGVVSYSVNRRRNEIGIRMALGARSEDLHWLVLRQGLAPVAVGLGVAVAVALILGRMISSLLFGVRPHDPLTIAVAVIVLAGVAALACYVPARRASKLDPMVALRYE